MNEMTTQEFKDLMKQAEMTKKSFSEILGTSYNAVNGWGTNNRGYPYWVRSWLNLYIENKECKELKQLLKDTVCKNEESSE